MSEDKLTDHESILLIRSDISNLKESQDNFHKEMRATLAELKDNYAGRLNNHETRLNKLESSSNKNAILLSIGIGILSILTSILIYHVIK